MKKQIGLMALRRETAGPGELLIMGSLRSELTVSAGDRLSHCWLTVGVDACSEACRGLVVSPGPGRAVFAHCLWDVIRDKPSSEDPSGVLFGAPTTLYTDCCIGPHLYQACAFCGMIMFQMPSAAKAYEGIFVHAFRLFEASVAGGAAKEARHSERPTLQYAEYARLVREWAFGIYNMRPARHRVSSRKFISRLAASAVDEAIVRLVDACSLNILLNPVEW